MEDRQIRSWIRFACDCNGVPELAQVILVEWNTRFTCRLGDAIYNPVSYRARIRISSLLFPRASEQVRMETLIHETSHIVVGYKYGYAASAHGSEWKKAMRNCGVEPRRLHSVDRTGLARRRRRFILCDCPNEQKCQILIRHFNLVRRGEEFWCKVCGLHLHRESAIEEDLTARTTAQNF